MVSGRIYILSGEGRGKTSAALGYSIQSVSEGKNVIFIQFLKGKSQDVMQILKRFEPEIKLFSFEKAQEAYCDLSPEKRQEEVQNIKNGLNFAKKVLTTGGCDVLVLDEVLGLVDTGIISEQELHEFLDLKPESASVIMTGINVPQSIMDRADRHTEFRHIK